MPRWPSASSCGGSSPFRSSSSGPAPGPALRLSVDRTQGRRATLAAAVLTWAALHALLSAAVLALLRTGSGWVLGRVGPRLAVALPATAGLLALHALIVAALAILGSVSFA